MAKKKQSIVCGLGGERAMLLLVENKKKVYSMHENAAAVSKNKKKSIQCLR